MSKGKNPEERLLIALLIQGERDAFDEIYWKYQKAIYHNALRITRDEAVAQDVVQEVFISLWERRQLINPEFSLGGWLFVSSYNRSVNILRRKLRESLVLDKISNEEIDDDAISEIIDFQLEILDKAVSVLSPQKRRAFQLCKLEGKSYKEAAAEMKISQNTLKEYLSGALLAIKEYAKTHPVYHAVIISLFFKEML